VELSRALEYAGRLEEALAAAQEVVRRVPHVPSLRAQVAALAAQIEAKGKQVQES
jgi:hypothetical protein